MPYQSDKQRRWAHTDSAKKAGFPTEEFDKASKGMAEGGTVSDEFERSADYPNSNITSMPPEVLTALSMLGAPGAASAAEEVPGMLKGLGEAGEISIGRAAPKMEEMGAEAAPKLEAYIKGIQKGYKGSPDIKIWGVKGDPAEISKLGFGSDPASIPENILREKGVLPEALDMTNKTSPNSYSHGGIVDKHISDTYGPKTGYADGGEVSDPGIYDVTDSESAPKNITPELSRHPFVNPAAIPPPAATLQFDPKAGLPPAPVNPPPVAPQAPVNTGITDYLSQQKQALNKFGPEQQMALQQQLTQERQGLGSKLPVAAGTFADALMQGVARAGNPGFANQIQGQQNKLAEEQLGTLKGAGQQNLQQTEAKMKLDAMDPESALSKAKQEQNKPILTSIGFSPDIISKMSASEMDQAINTLKDVGLKQREIMVKRMEMEIKLKEQYETARHNKQEEGLKGAEIGEKATTDIVNQYGQHPIVSPVTGDQATGAAQKLANIAGIGAKPGPYGHETVKEGKAYVWHPDTQKYYLKGE